MSLLWEESLMNRIKVKAETNGMRIKNQRKRITVAEQIVNTVRLQHGIHLDPKTFERLRPTPYQKSAGAWVWSIMETNGIRMFGSCFNARDCAKATYLTISKECYEFFPEEVLR